MHPFRTTLIPIISDTVVDMKLGTGAVGVNPYNEMGYEIAKRNNIPLMEVIDESGIMKTTNEYNNLKRYVCRKTLVRALHKLKLVNTICPHPMNLRICGYTGDVMSYFPREQCYLSWSSLNNKAADLVKAGRLQIKPDSFITKWKDVTADSRDWCISRHLYGQLFGCQVPMYKCTAGKKSVWVSADDEGSAKVEALVWLDNLPNLKVEQDKDIIDSWFTHAIFPFSELGYPKEHQSILESFPLSLMITGNDTFEAWVHKIVILSLALTDKLPFTKVLVHGSVRNCDGTRISKTNVNAIDPDDVIDGIPIDTITSRYEVMYKEGLLSKAELDRTSKYWKAMFTNSNGIPRCGADALRFTLLDHDVKSKFVNFDVGSCYINRLFCDKIWQCVFITQQYFQSLNKFNEEITDKDLTYFDMWILSRLADMVYRVNKAMASYNFHIATKALKKFIQDELCDIYIETTKLDLAAENPRVAYAHAHTLSVALNTSLRCLAPFMVYLTDELIPRIPGFKTNIIYNFRDTSNDYLEIPKYTAFKRWRDTVVENRVGELLSAIQVVSKIIGFYNITSQIVPSVYVNTKQNHIKSDMLNNKKLALNLMQYTDVKFEQPLEENVIGTKYGPDMEFTLDLEKEDVRKVLSDSRFNLAEKIKRMKLIIWNLKLKYASNDYLKTTAQEDQLSDRHRLETKKKILVDLQKLL